jgi:hypothetical protein
MERKGEFSVVATTMALDPKDNDTGNRELSAYRRRLATI